MSLSLSFCATSWWINARALLDGLLRFWTVSLYGNFKLDWQPALPPSSWSFCFKTMPNNYIWLAVYMFLGKSMQSVAEYSPSCSLVYSNSLLASLNHRSQLRDAIGRLTNIPTAALAPPVAIEMSLTSPDSAVEVVVEKHAYQSA